MNFTDVTSIVIPEGTVTQITNAAGAVLWQKSNDEMYVFVDSLDIPAKATLDTGIAHNSMNYMYIDFAPLASTTYGAVIHAGSSTIARFYIDGAALQSKINWYNQTIVTLAAGDRHQVYQVGQKTFLDGVQKVNMSGVPVFDADTNVIIGGIGQAMRLWAVKHGSDENTLDLNMVPAVRNSDQVAGLYDQISGNFFPYGAVTGG